MKQGIGRTTHSAAKVEPKSQAVNLGAVSRIGSQVGTGRKELYEGRGYEAPKAKPTIHRKGSQS